MSDRLELLEEVIDDTADLLDGIPADAYGRSTPCPDYTVADLVDHLVGWAHIFEAAAHETDAERNPDRYQVERDHGAAFRRAGRSTVTGLRDGGLDRELVMVSAALPAGAVVDMMTMEYPGHGWDLAAATGLSYPFDDRVVQAAHEAAKRMIAPPYRGTGEGQFHPVVPTGEDASALERFVAFLGRDPGWQAS